MKSNWIIFSENRNIDNTKVFLNGVKTECVYKTKLFGYDYRQANLNGNHMMNTNVKCLNQVTYKHKQAVSDILFFSFVLSYTAEIWGNAGNTHFYLNNKKGYQNNQQSEIPCTK